MKKWLLIIFLFLAITFVNARVDEGYINGENIKTVTTTKTATTQSSYGCYCAPSCSYSASCSFSNSGVAKCDVSYCSKTKMLTTTKSQTTIIKTTTKSQTKTTVKCVSKGDECSINNKCCPGLKCYKGICIETTTINKITTTTKPPAKVRPLFSVKCPDGTYGKIETIRLRPAGRGVQDVTAENIYEVKVCVPSNTKIDDIVGKIYKGEYPVISLKTSKGSGTKSDLQYLESTLSGNYDTQQQCTKIESKSLFVFFKPTKTYVCAGDANIVVKK